MNAITILKPLDFTTRTLNKGELYFQNVKQTNSFLATLKKYRLQDSVKVQQIDKVFAEFTGKQKVKNVYISRFGGIGDIVALSAVAKYIHEKYSVKVFFVTQEKYKALFDWFDCGTSFKSCNDSILLVNQKVLLKPNLAYINFEGQIEKSKENWFNLFFKNFDVDLTEFGRPFLKRPRFLRKSKNIKDENNILLTLKATANIRSINLEPVILALLPFIEKQTIYVHKDNLSQSDLIFIEKNRFTFLKVIEAKNLSEFLNDVACAKNVISTDTGALHFREGLGLSAIGLFGAFSSDCRTKYYKYTKSFNIKSDCNLQPCYQHCYTKDQICKNFKGNKEVAPCFDHNINVDLIDQLSDIFSFLS